MEPVKHQQSEPSIGLLNEIDILPTQVRLAELSIKQAQTAAADAVEPNRQTHQPELERRLGTGIPDSERELAATQRLLQEREEALDAANSSAVALKERLSRLGATSRDEPMTQRYVTRMAALHIEIEQKRAALEEQGAARINAERTYHAELFRLQAKSQEKHPQLESRNDDLLGEKYAAESPRERLAQLEKSTAQAKNRPSLLRPKLLPLTIRWRVEATLENLAGSSSSLQRKVTKVQDCGGHRHLVGRSNRLCLAPAM